MATRTQVLSLFGATPEQIQERQRQQQSEMILSQQDPYARTGAALGVGLARLFGGETPEVTRARQLQNVLQNVNMENPEEMLQAAGVLRQAGFPNEALGLINRADQFKTSAQQRAASAAQVEASEQQVAASKATVKRGQFDYVQEKEAVPVTLDGQTYYVSVDARVQYDKDTGTRTVQTSPEQLKKLAQQQAKKMEREDLAAKSEQTLRQAQLTTAQRQAKLAEKQLTQAERDANITTGLVRVPVEEEIKDLAGRVTGYRTGFEYKQSKGRMITDENGKEIFQPFLTDAMPVAEAVDETGLPQNAVKIEEGKQTTIKSTVSGQEFVVVGAGDEAQYYQIITEGDNKYYLPNPIDPKTINLQQPTEETVTSQQPTSTVTTRVSNRITQKPTDKEADRTVRLIQQITGQ